MRRRVLLVLTFFVVAVGLLVLAARHHRGEAETLPRSSVSLIGDSLNLGTEQSLRAALRRWTFYADDVVGRSTATGVEGLRDAGSSLAPYVVVSLGTNDPSSGVDAFRGDVAQILHLAGPRRCVVWSTIHRDGDAYDGFNAILRAEAARNRNVFLVEWASMISQHPDWLASDGIHGSPDGYVARAAAVVVAMRECHTAGVGR